MRPRCCSDAGGSSAGIGWTMGGGLVEAVGVEFLDESVLPVLELLEPLELFLFLRAQGGRSVCCGGGGD
jgi:hypothetical protein